MMAASCKNIGRACAIEKGTSLNFYDNRDQKWHQIYYDNSGNMGNYPPMAGGLKDGRMVMMTSADQTPLSRWTFYVISEGSPTVKAAPGPRCGNGRSNRPMAARLGRRHGIRCT